MKLRVARKVLKDNHPLRFNRCTLLSASLRVLRWWRTGKRLIFKIRIENGGFAYMPGIFYAHEVEK